MLDYSITGYHTLYDWYRKAESEHFPDPTGLRARLEQWTFGLYPACIKYLMSAFDIPEVILLNHTKIHFFRWDVPFFTVISLSGHGCN
jgi:hypothetical protein